MPSSASKKRRQQGQKKKKKKGRNKMAESDPAPPRAPPLSEPNPSTNGGEAEAATSSGADCISLLPDCVLASILSLLPLKEAMRTSVLSSRWRHLWTLCPIDVDIEPDLQKLDMSHLDEFWQSYIDAASGILSCHRGLIRSFRLHRLLWGHLLFTGQLDQTLESWAETLVQNGIQGLILYYRFPRQLLACESLRVLDLVEDLVGRDHPKQIQELPPNLRELKLGPKIPNRDMRYITQLPPAFLACKSLHSFELRLYSWEEPHKMIFPPNLRELTLWETELNEWALSNIMSGCPFLDALCLDGCKFTGDVRICSPSLRGLSVKHFDGSKVEVNLVILDAPNLELLMFGGGLTKYIFVKVVSAPNLRVWGFIQAEIWQLAFGDTRFQLSLAPYGILTKFGTPLYTLKTLGISVELGDMYQQKVVAYLLKCFPCLEFFDILISGCQMPCSLDEEYWLKETSFDCLDHHLKVVNIIKFPERPNNLGLLRFLVRNARLLKVISLFCDFELTESWEETIKNELRLEHRASSYLQVAFERNCDNHPKLSTWKTCLD